jgi:CoA:oxalate CoA-transferase
MPGPLEGIKILDFTWALAGPYGVMQLCDLGATVWKVEVVGQTEDKRAAGPIVDGINTYTFSINRGKQSILLDLKSARGREIALQLAEKADVVIENFSAGTVKGLGLDYEAISARNPAIVYASLSGFGQTGPYAHRGAVDVIVQGLGGVMSITGYPDGPPARVGYSIGDMAGGLFMAQGVLAALVERGRSGKGQYIDVAMLDAQVNLAENAVVRHFATGEVPGRIGTRHPLNTPFQALPTKDGYVVLAGVRDWALFCALIEHDELIDDPRYLNSRDRTKHHAELEPVLFEAFRQKTNDEWMEILGAKFLIAPLNTIADMGRDPQVNHREMLIDLPSWKGRSFRVVNSPVKLSRTPVKLTEGTDRPGGHTRAILKDVLGLPDAEIESLYTEGVAGESWE